MTPFQAGTLAYGLRPDSRILLKSADMDMPLSQMILMKAADELSIIRWLNTKDGANGTNRPVLLAETFRNRDEETNGFDTPEEFMRSYYGE